MKRRNVLFFIAVTMITGFVIGSIVTSIYKDREEKNNDDVVSNYREFTIDGTYDISEIRINVNVENHPTIEARGNLLTLGFTNLDEPITRDSEFLVRYVDAQTNEVVEFYANDAARYVVTGDLDELFEKIEEYRMEHNGQSLVFDRYGNINVTNNSEVVIRGGYLWGGHTLAVVMLDPEAGGPRYDSRNYLFFPNNEEFMQGANCRRIIVREKSQSRGHGSIEIMFGSRCPDSTQPLPEEPEGLCPDAICPE